MNNSEPILINMPPELRTPALWVQYYLKVDPKHPDKKPSKVPTVKWGTSELRAANLRPLDKLLERPQRPGGGFQRYIEKDEGLVYVDLDKVRNVDTLEVEPWAQELIEELDSYTEVSASGKGFHIVCRGKLAEDFHLDPNPVEIYSGNSGKLMALTGDVHELHFTIENRQEKVDALLKRMKGGKTTEQPTEADPVAKSKADDALLDVLAARLIEAQSAGQPTEDLRKQLEAAAAHSKPPADPAENNWRGVFHTGAELDSTPGVVFIKGILEEGITFFGALSATGKTWIGLSIAHALLSGEPLFGVFPVVKKTNVLYLVPEMGGRKFRERLVKMHIGMDGGFFCQTVRDGAIDLDDPLLLQAIKDTQAVVILDTAIRFQAGDEQSSSQQAQGLGAKMFKLIAAGAQAVICMHHRSKDRKDKEPTLENTLRGTGDFGAMADCVWCVEHSRKKKGGYFDTDYEEESRHLTRLTLTCVKPRDMEPADPFTIQGRPYINEKGDFVVLESEHVIDDAAATKEPVNEGKDALLLKMVEENPSVSQRSLRTATGYGFKKILKIMEDNHWSQEDGKWVEECDEQPPL
jgi:hypothetical protein